MDNTLFWLAIVASYLLGMMITVMVLAHISTLTTNTTLIDILTDTFWLSVKCSSICIITFMICHCVIMLEARIDYLEDMVEKFAHESIEKSTK